MTQQERSKVFLTVSQGVLLLAILVMVLGYAASGNAQIEVDHSQAAINATLFERQAGQDRRLDRIERMLEYGMTGLIANLVAHLFQISVSRRKESGR